MIPMAMTCPSSQLPLLDPVGTLSQVTIPERVPQASIADRFEKFHQANPLVYVLLKRLARQVLGWDRTQYSIATLFEVLRWNYSFQTDGDDFKLNNDFRAFYARMLNADFGREVFAVRSSAADEWVNGKH